MTQGSDSPLSETIVRKAWQQLIAQDLPRAATARGWSLTAPAEFERVLLDQVHPAPSNTPRRPCVVDLVLAIELGQRALRGQVCLDAMDRRSRAMRSRPGPRVSDLARILADICPDRRAPNGD